MKTNRPLLLTQESIDALKVATEILTSNPDIALVKMLDLCAELTASDTVKIYYLNQINQNLTIIAGHGISDPSNILGKKISIFEGIVGVAARKNQIYISNNTKYDPIAHNSTENINSAIALPISSKGQVKGVLTLESSKINNFSPEQVQLLELLSSILATTFELPTENLESDDSTLPLAFVLMPFQDPFNKYYNSIILPSIREAGFNGLRADQIFGPTEIVQDIWKAINEAEIIIAELTTKNPNVMYELGLSHAIGKSVIMLSQGIDDIPFDLRSLRCIIYDTIEPDWAEKLKESIKKYIEASVTGNSKHKDFLKNISASH